MEKYKNIYRIPSARLQSWDYGSLAEYFVTICTRNKEHHFGEIINNKMHIAAMGAIAEQEWLRTPSIRPDMNITLDEFVVMPNHFHGILIIGKNEFNDDAGRRRDAMHRVSTATHANKMTDKIISINSFGPQRKNLSSIIGGFKSSVTTYARKNNIPFVWQERFHDHIIRDEKELDHIRNYIMQNIANWKNDKFY